MESIIVKSYEFRSTIRIINEVQAKKEEKAKNKILISIEETFKRKKNPPVEEKDD